MSASSDSMPLRRSPLAERHRRLGARFVASGEWPATYGDVQRERRAVSERVGLNDWGPLDKLSLGGGGANLPAATLGAITTGEVDGRTVQLWGLTDDESLLVAPAGDPRSSVATAERLERAGVAATDVSSFYAVLRLVGPRARDLLENLFPEDVSDRALTDRAITFGPLANVTVALGRLDHERVPGYTILVEREHAEYLWDALLGAGAAYGIEPVGAAALAKD